VWRALPILLRNFGNWYRNSWTVKPLKSTTDMRVVWTVCSQSYYTTRACTSDRRDNLKYPYLIHVTLQKPQMLSDSSYNCKRTHVELQQEQVYQPPDVNVTRNGPAACAGLSTRMFQARNLSTELTWIKFWKADKMITVWELNNSFSAPNLITSPVSFYYWCPDTFYKCLKLRIAPWVGPFLWLCCWLRFCILYVSRQTNLLSK
jgi:hypothetical protein